MDRENQPLKNVPTQNFRTILVYSLKTLLWLLAILLLPQIILGVIYGVYYEVAETSSNIEEVYGTWATSIPVLLSMSFLSPIISIPILLKASKPKNSKWQLAIKYWSIDKVQLNILVKWLKYGLVFWLVLSALPYLLNTPIEQFMKELKVSHSGVLSLLMILLTVCLVMPIMEEIIFRGWLYSKINQTQLGGLGALISTSTIFTLIHTQYNHLLTLASVFSLGLLLGFIRYKTGNTSYAIAVHISFNVLSMCVLYLADIQV